MKSSDKTDGATSRRDFLKTAVGAAVGGAVGVQAVSTAAEPVKTYMPSTAAGMARVIGANDRIHIGHIGPHWEGQGGVHARFLMQHAQEWNVEYVAIADIYTVHLQEAQQHIGLKDSQCHIDYREMLEKHPEIDVVWITTPEHWHAQQTIDCLEAGKDVYVEKPLCKGVEPALKIKETVERTKRVLQMGTQGATDPTYHRIAELINSGKYGEVVWARGSYCRNTPSGEWDYYPLEPQATEENTHWHIFEQPCRRKHPFSKDRFFRWRKYWSYSAGIQSDLFPHVLAPFLIAIGKIEWPRRVVAAGDLLLQKDREVPDTVHMIIEYPSQFTVVLSGSTNNDHGYTPTICTNKATIEFAMFGGGNIQIIPQSPYADQVDPLNEHVPGASEAIDNHEKNFLDCVRDRTKVPNANVDLAAKVQVAIGMGEIAYRENREVLFDTERLRLI
ncbi:MAG TPA: Gfo/Idh/MocA family oxidoreductase [Chthonomonas sp.]|uniref:Gfo/Idh/MocA family protein n=1 Tax=Chthonomonas sp. TaxID=2282153 RepID=UPI002B4AE709|nr:Gfo/Idh/MocA family oxidoreductase [Chthonomonas sp.]HLI49580.1 Gfo/Idh/MocA family oxidoreductase [Chthonomonas sp.]